MRKEKKMELVNKYMTKDIPEITDFQREWIRKETAHYIFVDRDENGNHKCHCDRCNKDVDLGKTVHKAKVICPSCGHELEIVHKWRIAKLFYKETIDWIMIPRIIDSTTLMLRYVCAHRQGLHLHIFEGARIVFNTQQKSMHYFEKGMEGWKYTRASYFAEFNMYNYRTWCCLPAKKYTPLWKRELNRLDCFKFFPEYMDYVDKYYYLNSGLRFITYKAPLYEKLKKAGFEQLAEEDFKAAARSIDDSISYNTKQNSLMKMLGLNKTQFKVLKNNQTVKAYNFIKLFPNITQDYLDRLVKAHISESAIAEIKRKGFNVNKVLNYVNKNSVDYYEWMHYIKNLEVLGYQLDDNYMYPKDFRKEDARVAKEYNEEMERRYERAREEEKRRIEIADRDRDKLIVNISNALRKNKELMEFFAGSNGLQIFVPESADDLRKEGRSLHNCLGTYVDRYANGKTLIFFIRRIENPTAPYIAMEYCHGRIIQCRFDCNRAVQDEKIINFAQALADRLVKENILAA